MNHHERRADTGEDKQFLEYWARVVRSGQPMNPTLLAESGMSWYRAYQQHTSLPGVWVHPDAIQTPELPQGKLAIFIAAPSHAGKDATVQYIQTVCPGLIYPVITATDRPPRPGETHGVHQLFLQPEEFQRWAASGKFIEYSQTRPPYWFGIPRTSVSTAMDRAPVQVFRITNDGIESIQPVINAIEPTVTIAIIPTLRLTDYRSMLYDSGKENPSVRYATALEEIYRFGQPPHPFSFIIENPWDKSHVPHQAGSSLHQLLHQLSGTTHVKRRSPR